MEINMKKVSIDMVGISCIVLRAQNPEELWQNVLPGRRFFRKAPDVRLPQEWCYDPHPPAPGKTYRNQLALITTWRLDPFKFKIAPISQYSKLR